MFDDGFGEVGDKNSGVVSFSKFWGCILSCFRIYYDTWLMPLEGNDFIPPLCVQSKYSSLFTHWNRYDMNRGFIVPIIQKPKKMEKVGS